MKVVLHYSRSGTGSMAFANVVPLASVPGSKPKTDHRFVIWYKLLYLLESRDKILYVTIAQKITDGRQNESDCSILQDRLHNRERGNNPSVTLTGNIGGRGWDSASVTRTGNMGGGGRREEQSLSHQDRHHSREGGNSPSVTCPLACRPSRGHGFVSPPRPILTIDQGFQDNPASIAYQEKSWVGRASQPPWN